MSALKKHVDKKGKSFPHLYIDGETQEFWVVVRVQKKIKKRSLKTKDYLEAIGQISSVIQSLGAELSEQQLKTVPTKLICDYWADLRSQKIEVDEVAPATLSRIDGVWEHHLKDYFGHMRP